MIIIYMAEKVTNVISRKKISLRIIFHYIFPVNREIY